MRAWILFLLWACTFNTAHAEEFSAKVIAVLDGDTVLVLRGSQKVKIRLVNIDAPEKAQDFGMASRQSLVEMVLRKQVQINSQAIDQYGRIVAQLEVGGLKVNEEQVRRGMAWAAVGWRQSRRAPPGVPLAGDYSNFASLAASRQSLRDPLHSDRLYITLQNEAQQARRGLWAQVNPTPPWDWRKQHPSVLPAQSNAAGSSVTAHTTAASPEPTCGNKKRCSEMASCEEARHYFTICGIKALDSDGDGTPCEKLCKPVAR